MSKINHHSGQYDSRGKVRPQEEDWDTCEYRIYVSSKSET